MRDIREILAAGPAIPILTLDHVQDVRPLAEALLEGGLRVLEVTLRTEAGFWALTAIARDCPGLIVGAGTVLLEEQVNKAADCGAQFLVSPGLTQNIARATAARGIAWLPGIATASDIMRGRELGFAAFKFFPAEASGGIATLRAFQGPFPDVRFCPTGGVGPANARDYLALRNVACIAGSWIMPKDAIEMQDWNRIRALSHEAVQLR
jgi:2-dehydro-3-deoxyphosphogluconate aldolase / (4S)-4-hydroxy-2-oxoglutarate aldolase